MSDRFAPHVDELLSGVRFGKFVSVGAIGAVFDTITFVTLDQIVGLPTAIATAIGIEVAILVMFTVNDVWTFADEGSDDKRSLLRRLLRSHLVRAGGSSLQWVIVVLVLVVYSVTLDLDIAGINLWPVLVKGGAIGIAMTVNYVFESLFTWRVHDDTVNRGKK